MSASPATAWAHHCSAGRVRVVACCHSTSASGRIATYHCPWCHAWASSARCGFCTSYAYACTCGSSLRLTLPLASTLPRLELLSPSMLLLNELRTCMRSGCCCTTASRGWLHGRVGPPTDERSMMSDGPPLLPLAPCLVPPVWLLGGARHHYL